MSDITCRNCGKVIASAQWAHLRTKSYHEQGHCAKNLEAFRLDRYMLDKEKAKAWELEFSVFAQANPRWLKYPKRLAQVQAHCPHKHTQTLLRVDEEDKEIYTLNCKRCWKILETLW